MALPKFISDQIKNLVGAPEKDKIDWYAGQLAQGLSDAEIRARVNETLGSNFTGYEPDWQYLKSKAALPVTPEIAKDEVINRFDRTPSNLAVLKSAEAALSCSPSVV